MTDDGHFVMIPLSKGKFAIADEADADSVLSKGKWRAVKSGYTYYALWADAWPQPLVSMHCLILGTKGVDHANRNGLDNRRINLRPANGTLNNANKAPQCNNTSGYKGVSWDRQRKKWAAIISADGRRRRLGMFDDPAEAALAYNRAAIEAFGEYAWLNPA